MKTKDDSNLTKDISRIIGVAVFFIAASWTLQLPWIREEILDISRLRSNVDTIGGVGFLAFLSILALINGLGMPRLWMSTALGALYGAVEGSIIAQLITLSGATLNFLTGRWILRGPIKRRLPEKLKVWYERFSENGFRWVLYIRLFPFGNATIVNLISGASKIRFLPFILATFIGYLPFTITFALFGSGAAKQKWHQLVFGLILFIAVIGGRWVYNKVKVEE